MRPGTPIPARCAIDPQNYWKVVICTLLFMAHMSWAQIPGRAAGGSPRVPPPTPPATRPYRVPVDISNSVAVYRELAELGSFAFCLDRYSDGTATQGAVGIEFGPDPNRQLDAAVRFDRLMESSDPVLKKATQEVRGIFFDDWRINRGNDHFGWSPKQPNIGAREVLAGAIASVVSEAFDEATSPRGETHSFTDRQGHTATWRDPDPPVEYSERTSRFQAEYERTVQTLAKDSAQRDATWRMLLWAHAGLEYRLAGVWREALLPRLIERAGPASKTPLVQLSTGPKGQYSFRNASGRALNHVTLVFTVKDDQGTALEWYAYLRVLKAGQNGWPFFLPQGKLNEFSTKIEQTISLYCDEGRDVARVAHLPAAVDPHVKLTREDVIANERESLARSREMLGRFTVLFGSPQNPDKARERLWAALRAGGKWEATIPGKPTAYVLTLGFLPLKNPSDVVHVECASGYRESPAERVGRAPASMVRVDFADGMLMGKFVEEPDRGCVVGLVPAPSRAEERLRTARAGYRSGARGAALQKQTIDSMEAELKTQREPVFQRMGRVLTSPLDAQEYFVPGFLELAIPPGPSLDFFMQRIANAPYTSFAMLVVFCDAKGQVWLQAHHAGRQIDANGADMKQPMVVVRLTRAN
jgi:hypothetical protein